MRGRELPEDRLARLVRHVAGTPRGVVEGLGDVEGFDHDALEFCRVVLEVERLAAEVGDVDALLAVSAPSEACRDVYDRLGSPAGADPFPGLGPRWMHERLELTTRAFVVRDSACRSEPLHAPSDVVTVIHGWFAEFDWGEDTECISDAARSLHEELEKPEFHVGVTQHLTDGEVSGIVDRLQEHADRVSRGVVRECGIPVADREYLSLYVSVVPHMPGEKPDVYADVTLKQMEEDLARDR